jgi:4,5-dihydroxyphthalate decarboxylase
MHVLGVRRELAEAQPWLPATLLKAFTRSKEVALTKLSDTSATKVTLPFLEEQLRAVRTLMGEDYWGYGLEAGRVTLDSFLHHHHAQGLSPRRLRPEDLFVPSTFETTKI